MRALTDRQLLRVREVLLDEVHAFAPDWTDQNDSDPGVTLLGLFAFLTEGLIFRQKAMPERGVSEAKRLAEAARALTGSASLPGCGVRRVNYFSGQLLGEDDLRDEQDYFRERLRRLNRFLEGSGVVSGLNVSVAPGAGGHGQAVVVEPGFALNPRGELPAPSGVLFVQLLFRECPTEPVPALPPASDASTAEVPQRFSRVEETFAIVLAETLQPDAVTLARLTAGRGRWRIDRDFKTRRDRN